MVEDTFRWKTINTGSLAYLGMTKEPLSKAIHTRTSRFMQLRILEKGRVSQRRSRQNNFKICN